MRMKTKNDEHVGKWNGEQSAENGSHAEKNQQGPAPIPSDIGTSYDTGNNCNNGSNGAKRK
jgi:hypothetical protein